MRNRLLPAALALTTSAALLTAPAVATAAPAAAPKAATSKLVTFDSSLAYDVGSNQPLTTPTPATPLKADANGGTTTLTDAATIESAQGIALTTMLPGGDALQLFSAGEISRVKPDGGAAWQVSTATLYRDWGLSWVSDFGFQVTPQLAVSTDPVAPFETATATPGGVKDTQILTTADFNGDGTPDVAVAELVGINLGLSACGPFCSFPFTVPGSDLHLGSFVSVLDGRTGKMIYHELDPGIVTQLAVAGGHLVIGDETGSPRSDGGIGAWNSETSVRAIALHATHGTLTASPVWSYATGAQWGRLLGLSVVDGGIAVSWTDTPLGLGVPGPPDGHVVLLDGKGHATWDQRTTGYPVLSAYDASRHLIAVAQEIDPFNGVGYTLTGLRVSDGRTVVSVPEPGVLPTVLTVGASWLVGGVDSTPDEVAPPQYFYDSSSLTSVDPATGRTRWTRTLRPGADGTPGQPGSLLVSGNTVVVGSWLSQQAPTPAQPYEIVRSVQGYSLSTGAPKWQADGDVADAMTLAVDGSTVRGVTAEQRVVHYSLSTGAVVGAEPLMGLFLAAVAADVNGDGRQDEIAGDESGAVYAFNGRNQGQLWRADVGAAVHQIVAGTLDGRPVLAVAATDRVAVVDQRTGRVLHTYALTGQYVWNVAIGTVNGRTVVATGTDRLSAFDAATGRTLWTYRPPTSAYFANAAIADGTVVGEYQGAAVGIDALSGRTAWTAPTTDAPQLQNGVIAGPGLAAFTWTTADNQGRVDVRNPKTGALLYSDTSSALAGHAQLLLDPVQGLFSIGNQTSVKITPNGLLTAAIGGTGGALAGPVLVTSSTSLSAWPASAFTATGDWVDPLATGGRLYSGQVVPAGNGEVLSLPFDDDTHKVLLTEYGRGQRDFPYAAQRGLEVITVTGRPAATAAPRKVTAQPVPPIARPTTLPLATGSGGFDGHAQPAGVVKVQGYAADGDPELTNPDPTGYDPATIRAYLHLTGTGAGQTVAVVDAAGDSNLASDLDHFSKQFGLPAAKLSIVAPDGIGDVDPDWGLETAMDVEWIHATAPQAAIVLVEAHDALQSSLFRAVQAAATLKPDAISLSWGVPIEFTDETYYDHFCALSSTICVVSSGDRGNPGGYPAYNPAVLAVGGTTLTLGTGGAVTDEQSWAGSGGGRSYVEGVPAYQKGLVSGGRGIPDVSYEADPDTGVAVFDTEEYQGETGWFQVGGTSLGAPTWSALIASADQLRAAAGEPRLTEAQIYAAKGSLGDITTGPDNGLCPDVCSVGQGYDFVTGLGSPRAGLDLALKK